MPLFTISRLPFRAAVVLLICASPLSGAEAASAETEAILAAARWAGPVMGQACDFSVLKAGDLSGSRFFEIRYREKGQSQDEPDNVYPLVQLFCGRGAYNESFVFVGKDRLDGGYRLLSFAEPKVDFDYVDENFTTLKAAPTVTGFVTRAELVNTDFDPATGTLFMSAKWRGLGDAWSSGQWAFVEGEFVLKEYTIDPTYDLNAAGADENTAIEGAYSVYPQVRKLDE